MHTDQEINHEVLVLLLKQIRDILQTPDEPVEGIKADEIRAALRNELAGVIRSIKDIPEVDNKDILKELKSLKDAINAIEVKPTVTVEAAQVHIPEIRLPDIQLPVINVPVPQVNYTAPELIIPAPTVNLPPPIVNLPELDLKPILNELDRQLNKIRTNSVGRPLAVRLSDGQEWLKELQRQTAQTTQYMSDVSYSKNAAGMTINPATEESLNQLAGKFAIQIDDVSTANVKYIGKATVGSAVGSAVWQIMKIDKSGTPITTVITFANGSPSFSNIFSNRTSLTYS